MKVVQQSQQKAMQYSCRAVLNDEGVILSWLDPSGMTEFTEGEMVGRALVEEFFVRGEQQQAMDAVFSVVQDGQTAVTTSGNFYSKSERQLPAEIWYIRGADEAIEKCQQADKGQFQVVFRFLRQDSCTLMGA